VELFFDPGAISAAQSSFNEKKAWLISHAQSF